MFHHEVHCQGRDQIGIPVNIRFWHKADAYFHVNALPLNCQQPNSLLRNYGFSLESSPPNKL